MSTSFSPTRPQKIRRHRKGQDKPVHQLDVTMEPEPRLREETDPNIGEVGRKEIVLFERLKMNGIGKS